MAECASKDEIILECDDLQRIILKLNALTPATEEYDEAVEKLIVSGQLLDRLQSLLTLPISANSKGHVVAAQLLAELAKAENVRLILQKRGLIPILIPLLSHQHQELCLQVIRVLGNLCYEQDICREEIAECGGVQKMDELLKLFLTHSTSSLDIKTLSCAFLHNLLNGNEVCVKAVLKTSIVDSLRDLLENNATVSPRIAYFCVMILTSIAEIEGGREMLYKSQIPAVLVKVLINAPVRPVDDTKEGVFGLLSTLTADSDEVKVMLAESTIDMYLLRIISTLSPSEEEDEIELVKLASELIVLVLTGDDAMKIWFDGGDGLVFTSVSEWLQSSNGQLLQSAAFALGNFARDDRNSLIIIQRGISSALCKCLDQLHDFCSDNRTAPTIHALLSALRNLAIAPSNKQQLLEQGILKHLLPYIDCENSIVTSKLVGAIRLLIDGRSVEASYVGEMEVVIEKLVFHGDNEANMLLKGEATRCLAWIIKNSRQKKVLQNIIKHNAFRHLVFLVNSEHVIMQNEGLIGIVLLVTTLPEETKKASLEHKLPQVLTDLLNKEEPPAKETLLNTLTLLMELINIGMLDELVESNAEAALVSLGNKIVAEQDQGEKITELINAVKSSLHL
ncbi:RAP1GDS1 [Bugula neritina]|uniref:RAP1GDS1 n=1 Tax=Bugula neritina TaxID=10212 RepID=A0A7J7JHY2_BUGNE|nr:RAP1GDS1 [Bugula neritina]